MARTRFATRVFTPVIRQVVWLGRPDAEPASPPDEAEESCLLREACPVPVVLGDEPTGAVDSQTSGELVSLMRRMNREEGVTFVIVTHDLDLAGQTDRIVQLKDGRVVSDAAVVATLAG